MRIVAPPAAIKRLPWYVRAVLFIEEVLYRLRGVGERQASIVWTPCSTCPNSRHCAEGDGCMRPTDPLADDRRWAQLFIDVPSATWLDPNLYGDDPNWRARLFPPAPRGRYDHLPIKKTATAIRAHCERCGHDLIYKKGIGVGEYTTLCTGCGDYRDERDDPYWTLPCGHTGSITKMRAPYTGWHVSRCDECKAEWEPRSDDSSGRSLAQGESVWYLGMDTLLHPPRPIVRPSKGVK
jgi:hypothetical protein